MKCALQGGGGVHRHRDRGVDRAQSHLRSHPTRTTRCVIPPVWSTCPEDMKKMVRGTSFLSRSKGGAAKAGAPADEPAVTDSGAGTVPTPAASTAQQPIAAAQPMTASGSSSSAGAADENAALRSESERLREENEALKGQVHLLKFKVDLLVDMVTLANLDCDKLEDEVCACLP